MAGPGGGPPRRSHTKSRKGCDTCKKRHIRCDENFPQCRNCTKHKIRCPYNIAPPVEERSSTPDKIDLMWTAEIEAAIERWQLTGEFPFPSLQVYPQLSPQSLSKEDLRLIYHVASISHEMAVIGASGFTLWARQIPIILGIGATHKYVLHALLSFSAMHITSLNKNPQVGNLAYEHRGKAFAGLGVAISSFSKETSDAVLAASLVLSWQATDWRSWTHLMQGTSTIIDSMEPWKHESQFGDFIAERSTFPTAPASPAPDHKPNQPHKEDLAVIQQTLQQLQKVEAHLKQSGEDTSQFSQLIAFVKAARKISPMTSVSQQFDHLQPLRQWLFWLPVHFLKQWGASPNSLVVIAHYYTVALLMERLFPEIGAAYFGSMTISPVEEIAKRVYWIENSSVGDGVMPTALDLMQVPINTVTEFRRRMGWPEPARTQSFPPFDPPTFYKSEAESPQMPLAPTTQEFMPYGSHPMFSYSTEDLSVINNEAGPSGTGSPLQMSSPFNAGYLGIPGPSYGGYSPTSSNYGDFGDASSIGYSDNEDFGPFDMNSFSPATPVLGGSSAYGLGFVTPVHTAQPVWI